MDNTDHIVKTFNNFFSFYEVLSFLNWKFSNEPFYSYRENSSDNYTTDIWYLLCNEDFYQSNKENIESKLAEIIA